MSSYLKRRIYNELLAKAEEFKIDDSNTLFWQYVNSFMEEMPEEPDLRFERGYKGDAGPNYDYTLQKTEDYKGKLKGIRFIEWSVNVSDNVARTNAGITFGFITPDYRTSQRFSKRECGNYQSYNQELTSSTEARKKINNHKERVLVTETGIEKRGNQVIRMDADVDSYIEERKKQKNIEGITSYTVVHEQEKGLWLDIDARLQSGDPFWAKIAGSPGMNTINLSDDEAVMRDMLKQRELLEQAALFRKTDQRDKHADRKVQLMSEYFASLFSDDMEVEIAYDNSVRVYRRPIKQ